MKKILVLTAVFALVASAALASDVSSGATGTMNLDNSTGYELHGDDATASKTTALIGKCSTGVGIAWQTDANGYAIMTQHKSGTKAYGSSYDSTALYVTTTDLTPGTEMTNLTASDTTDFADTTKWKKL